MSTIKVNNIDTQSGSTITVPTGKVFTITDNSGVSIGGTTVTASGAELNTVDVTAGTATASKAVVLDSNSHTSAVKTTALSIGASGSATAVTATGAELNYLDITTLGTSEDSKALTQASSVVTVGATSGNQVLNVASHDLVDGGLKLAGTLVTSSATEINLLDGKTVVGDAVLATAQEWTKTQNFNSTALSFDATQDWDLSANQVCSLTLTANTTFDAPTNQVDGAFYAITLIQDGTGGWTGSWNAVFHFAGGTAPTLTTAASSVDLMIFRSNGTNMLEAGRQLDIKTP
jgi:hypothetical protein